MEAHDLAFRAGFQVSSYGAGNRVRLPGQTQDDPRVFEFGTPYHEMFKRLYEENFHFYSKNGNLQMLDRDRKLKFCPQRWQDETRKFDIVVRDFVLQKSVTDWLCMVIDLQKKQFEDAVQNLSSISSHKPKRKRATHVVNVETVDNHRAAKVGSQYALKLLEMVSLLGINLWLMIVFKLYEHERDWEDHITDILDKLEETTGAQVLHTLIIY
jgi:RNA polymerase II subunit A C-terminal domain phosphatase SSU72